SVHSPPFARQPDIRLLVGSVGPRARALVRHGPAEREERLEPDLGGRRPHLPVGRAAAGAIPQSRDRVAAVPHSMPTPRRAAPPAGGFFFGTVRSLPRPSGGGPIPRRSSSIARAGGAKRRTPPPRGATHDGARR